MCIRDRTVGDQIKEVLKIHNKDMSKAELEKAVDNMMEMVGIPANRKKMCIRDSIEGYGVVVADFARKAGIEFMNGAGIVTWFGKFHRNPPTKPASVQILSAESFGSPL